MPAGTKHILTLVFAAAFLTGCGGSGGDVNTSPFNSNPSANGSWTGSIGFHTSPFPTIVDMFIVQTGTNISARLVQLTGFGLCSPLASMTGEVIGDNLTMTMILSSNNATTLTAKLGASTISGTFTTSGSCDGGDQGDFSLSLVPSITSTQWSGNITPVTGQAIPLTASITEDQAGILTGSVSLSGEAAPCDSPITVTGQIAGRYISLIDSQGLLNAFGKVDSTGKNISDESASGTCVPTPGSFAGFSMTRP